MDKDKLLEDFAVEFPQLAEYLNNHMAGDYPTERILHEMNKSEEIKAMFESAKAKYSILLADMGIE